MSEMLEKIIQIASEEFRKLLPEDKATGGSPDDFLNPWRKKFKRVEVDPAQGKAIAIRMYEPPIGVS